MKGFIKIALAERLQLVRTAITHFLQDRGFKVVYALGAVDELIATLIEEPVDQPHLCLFDWTVPLDRILLIKELLPNVKIAVYDPIKHPDSTQHLSTAVIFGHIDLYLDEITEMAQWPKLLAATIETS